MRKIVALVRKDLLLYFRNPVMPLLLFLLPLLLAGLSAWMMRSNSTSPVVLADTRLQSDFEGKTILEIPAAGGELKTLSLQYADETALAASGANRKIALVWKADGSNRIMTVQTGNPRAKDALDLMERYLRPMPEAAYRLERAPVKPNELWITLMGVLLIMGSVTIAGASLSTEVENRNILALHKSGFTDSAIFLSKILFVTVTQTLLFLVFSVTVVALKILPFDYSMLWTAPILAAVSSLTGIFIVSISAKREWMSVGLMLTSFPAILYVQLADQLNPFVKWLFLAIPTSQASAFASSVFRGENYALSLAVMMAYGILIFGLSLRLFRRTVEKNG